MHPKTKPIIGVHLDLKGVAFRPGYLPQLLSDLAGQGINAVLVEYEDLFPFSGINVVEDRRTLWTEAGLRRFLLLAGRHGIEVIPLQQIPLKKGDPEITSTAHQHVRYASSFSDEEQAGAVMFPPHSFPLAQTYCCSEGNWKINI